LARDQCAVAAAAAPGTRSRRQPPALNHHDGHPQRSGRVVAISLARTGRKHRRDRVFWPAGGTRLVYLQLLRHDELQAQAENNRTAVVPIVPNRGLILDRNGIVLATNYSAYTLEITPSRVN
jgi:hypothetical protein